MLAREETLSSPLLCGDLERVLPVVVPGGSDYAPVTAYLSYLNGALQQDNLLSAGTFVAILIPLAVFFAMQRHFARGLTAGALHE